MYPVWAWVAPPSARGVRPSTSTVPALGAMSPASSRMSVVLPAPSGPTRPRILAAGSSALTPSRARVAPKLFTRPATRAAGNATALTSRSLRVARERCRLRRGHLHRNGHALTKHVVGIGHDDAEAIHQVIPHLIRLHALRRELCLRRDEADRAFVLLARHRVDAHVYRHPRLDAPETRLRYVGADPHRLGERERIDRLSRLHDGSGLARPDGDDAGARGEERGIGERGLGLAEAPPRCR